MSLAVWGGPLTSDGEGSGLPARVARASALLGGPGFGREEGVTLPLGTSVFRWFSKRLESAGERVDSVADESDGLLL